MDELVRRLEREASGGDAEAALRRAAYLLKSGREPPALSIEDRIRLGLFDTFATRLRRDIVREAELAALNGEPLDDHVNTDPAWWPVDLVVNGERLVDQVSQTYDPQLPAHVVYLPSRHLLGEAYDGPGAWARADDDDKTLLLFCGCGYSDCGRLVAEITVTEAAVVWSGLEHRPALPDSEPSAPQDFVFARGDYEAALRDPR